MTARATAADGRFQPPEVRRRQILDAVARLAVTRGLDQISIAHVADEAGLAKGSIYLHFASRQDLLAALQADLWHGMLDAPRAIVADDQLSWAVRLDRVVDHLVRFSTEHQALYHAVFHTTGTDTDEPWTESRQVLRDLLAGGAAAGEFTIVDLDVTTDFLLHAYAGPCYHSTDAEHLSGALQRLFRRAVGASGAPMDARPDARPDAAGPARSER
jgi:TetR/AcrR family transcriptional repressor of nem operon